MANSTIIPFYIGNAYSNTPDLHAVAKRLEMSPLSGIFAKKGIGAIAHVNGYYLIEFLTILSASRFHAFKGP